MAKKDMNLDNVRAAKRELGEFYREAGKLSNSNVQNLSKELSNTKQIALSNKEIEAEIKKVNKEYEKKLKLQEQIIVKQETEYEIIQKKLGLNDSFMNFYKGIDKYQKDLNSKHEKTNKLFKDMGGINLSKIFTNPLAAMDNFSLKMINSVLNTGKNAVGGLGKFISTATSNKAGLFAGLAGAVKGVGASAGVAAIAFAKFTLPLLAIQAVVGGLIKMFDVMMKFNFGGIASQFGVAFAKIEHIWKVFEINIINTLKPLEPMFSEIFGNVADILVTVVTIVTDVFGSFFKGFVDGFGIVEGSTKGFISVFEGIMPVLESVGEVLKPVFEIIGKLTSLLMMALLPQFKLILAVAKPIFKTLEFLLKPVLFVIDLIVKRMEDKMKNMMLLQNVVRGLFSIFKTGLGVIMPPIMNLLDKAFKPMKEIISFIGDIFMERWSTFVDLLTPISDFFTEKILPPLEKIKAIIDYTIGFLAEEGKKDSERGVLEREGRVSDMATTINSPKISRDVITINNTVDSKDTGLAMARMQKDQLEQAYDMATQRGM